MANAAANLMSDLDVYKTSTDAIMEKFKNGELYRKEPKGYFARIISICDHFKTGIKNVNEAQNIIITSTNSYHSKGDYSKGIDFINDSFGLLDDYVDFICTDFEDFMQVVLGIVPKADLEYRCSVEFNLVEQLVLDLEKNNERIRAQLLSHFISKLSDEELAARAV